VEIDAVAIIPEEGEDEPPSNRRGAVGRLGEEAQCSPSPLRPPPPRGVRQIAEDLDAIAVRVDDLDGHQRVGVLVLRPIARMQ
jgi:hypothetical protein